MKILLKSRHRYPFKKDSGTGFQAKPIPSGSDRRLNDCLAKGLAELGHDVFYLLEGLNAKLPRGVLYISKPSFEADIFHNLRSSKKPWLQTCHRDPVIQDEDQYLKFIDHTIFVSQSLARTFNSDRFVLNGIDPSDFIYNETKDDYFLFICWLDLAWLKGLDLAISLSQKKGFPLVVAGGSSSPSKILEIQEHCKINKVKFVGDVDGAEKAELFAKAKGLLFPTQIEKESFGLVMAEALISGTPIICSDKGACKEIISPDVGFVCKNESDYFNAIDNIHKISSKACFEKANMDYHYLRMAEGYVKEYEREIERSAFH
ncbi:MAG: glycosyltransferase involved in cell wall biosynthesis [Saprospiraceae bacterium]|jgi:glycosyltransferase involved in cell wall biosynthesis